MKEKYTAKPKESESTSQYKKMNAHEHRPSEVWCAITAS
jgi:hypothetical protein